MVKKYYKQMMAALLVLALTITMIPVMQKPEETVVYGYDTSKGAIRAVIDNINQLPQYGKPISIDKRGTKEQPFFILEVVPYEEEAEFGFLIDGCEPVDVTKFTMDNIDQLTSNTLQYAATKNPGGGVFTYFSDEPEALLYNAGNTTSIVQLTSAPDVEGYLEYVGAGNGSWEITQDVNGNLTGSQKKAGGSFRWHRGNIYAVTLPAGSTIVYSLWGHTTWNVGECIPNIRRSVSAGDPLYQATVSCYKSEEVFLRHTLQLSEEDAAGFSVMIKTITPEELNASVAAAIAAQGAGSEIVPTWMEYADLIVVSSKSHNGILPELYKQYNRLGHTGFAAASYADNGFLAKDISGAAAIRMYNKITSDENHAAIILDDGVYNNLGITSKSITLDVYDWYLKKVKTYTTTGSYNNMYKLAVMLLSMDSNLFKSLYLDKSNPYIRLAGDVLVDTLQSGDASSYWSFQTFLLLRDKSQDPYTYWMSDEAWNNYHFGCGSTNENRKPYVNEHVFTYKGDSSITQKYGDAIINTGTYSGFSAYLADEHIGAPTTSDAVRFILGDYEKNKILIDELNVLDIEPCVALDGSSKPAWVLTESYVRMLVPSFTGKINITHQTTAEFNGKIEDLNSIYQMIYIGTDCGAYNLNGSGFPDWNDNSLDNKIYLHMGDIMYNTQAEYSDRTRSVNFLNNINYSGATINTEWAAEMRFPGNDITNKKMQDLKNYLATGYPIVAAEYLYDLDTTHIDSESYLYKLVREQKNAGNPAMLRFTDINGIRSCLASKKSVVEFISTPKLYSGKTVSDTSAEFVDQQYINPYGEAATLDFAFTVQEPGYRYRIFVDQDKNSKFSDNEVVYEHDAAQGFNSYRYRVASVMYGSVMWKIEVYNAANPQLRSQTFGCSAVKRRSGVDKKTINVLQIMPDNETSKGWVNLQKSPVFQKYYSDLEDYEVTMTSVRWYQFEDCFRGSNYCYYIDNDGSGVEKNANQVKKLILRGDTHDDVLGEVDLNTFNMIIIGFSDTYAGQDLTNRNGAAHWLQHYADSGKSILFTHDTTSMYNLQKPGTMDVNNLTKPTIFGSTMNAMMRDRLGMNQYGMVSNQLNLLCYDHNQTPVDEIQSEKNYMEKIYGGSYSTINSNAIHGFTYAAMERMGDKKDGSYNTLSESKGYRMIYKKLADNVGWKDLTDITTSAEQLNQGQITQYPYYISADDAKEIPVAQTHSQWFTLNLEDDDVTVWYTLSGGGEKTYAVSPGDAANNYYIYSKGNLFYSGVGHEKVEGDVEAKLFVNTMVAAYQATMEPPIIEILNGEAYSARPFEYTIEVPQEINIVAGVEEEEMLTGLYPVEFTPLELNLVTTVMTLKISIAGIPITEIYHNGSKITANGANEFVGVQNGQTYVLYYDKANLSNPLYRDISFEISNNKADGSNTTMLTMRIQPLFALD